ncbi:MAG: flagellar hook-associated protein FlgL [Deltaproteobacteria bacterium]|jgi:flagellar hook-associated protein 3 FlgL|nr:flagellar hook-associated protein FlgL [Deltaproteobacteria bacterium]
MIRVSQRQMYSNFLFRMNGTLSAYMDSHLQSSTQKKVNKPSDDPYGTAQIMASNTRLSSLTQYADNLNMAKGWLTQGENTLDQVHTSMTRVLELLEQASTGTYDQVQREIIGGELRQILEQMISYANTKFNGRHIFAGHETEAPPYAMTMGAFSRDPSMSQARFVVEGNLSKSAIVRFLDDGSPGNPTPDFQYTLDGGTTWINSVPADWSAGPPPQIRLGTSGASVKLLGPDAITPFDPSWIRQNNPASPHEDGTWIYLHHTAQYNGDTNSPTVVQSYPYNLPVPAEASGVFKRDVAVRVDAVSGNDLTYSYSLDDGVSWVEGLHAAIPPGVSSSDPIRISVEGGFLNLGAVPTPPNGLPPPAYVPGDQFIIRPHRADIDLTIGANANITINNIGLDIFGGLYQQPFSSEGAMPTPNDLDKNLFELIGRGIALVETNSQEGAQETLAHCSKVISHISLARTTIGARLNRVSSIGIQLDSLKLDESDRLSSLEDVDLAELMTRLTQQQLAYQSVLQSSSMIMQLSLMNFI